MIDWLLRLFRKPKFAATSAGKFRDYVQGAANTAYIHKKEHKQHG